MNRVIAALHSVKFAERGLADYGKSGNYFERQIGRWSKQYVASITQPIPEMDKLMEWLPAHMPASARDEGRLHRARRLPPGQPDVPPHRAARDCRAGLGAVHAGPPAGRLQLPLHELAHPAELGRGIAGWTWRPGHPCRAEYIQRYCQRTGIADVATLQRDWNFYLAYNMFRIAAILQGIAKRVEAGTASSAQAKASGDTARPMAELAWSFAQRA
jgi:aminoglycoside phosphotransferase (APT) family kinase protein